VFWASLLVGAAFHLPVALVLCAALGAVTAVAVRPWPLDGAAVASAGQQSTNLPRLSRPEAPAPEVTELLHDRSGRVLELVRYRIQPTNDSTPRAAAVRFSGSMNGR
jgi:hypothetical protein